MFTLARIAVASSLTCTLMQASALGISEPDTAPRWGRPLDVKVRVTGLASQEASNHCFQVDVIDGDHALPQMQVRWDLEASDSNGGADRWLRVRTSTSLREPIVTLTVETTCSSRFARTVTLLPEIPRPVEVAPTMLASATAVAAARPAGSESSAARAAASAPPGDAVDLPARIEVARAEQTPDTLTAQEPPAAGIKASRPAAQRPAPPARPRAAAKRKTPVAEARTGDSRPRLSLSQPTLLLGLAGAEFAAGSLQPMASVTKTAATAPAAAVPDAAQVRMQQEVARLGDLVRAQQEVIRRLESQQSATDPWRLNGPLGLLAGASTLLAVLVASRWRQRRRQQAVWWDTSVMEFLRDGERTKAA